MAWLFGPGVPSPTTKRWSAPSPGAAKAMTGVTTAAVPQANTSVIVPSVTRSKTSSIAIRRCTGRSPCSGARVRIESRVTPSRMVPVRAGVTSWPSAVTNRMFIVPHSSTQRCSAPSSQTTCWQPCSAASSAAARLAA